MNMFPSRITRCALFVVMVHALVASGQTVLVKPYVLPGDGAAPGKPDSKVIRWLTDTKPGDFTLEYELPGGVRTVVTPSRTALDFEKRVEPRRPAGEKGAPENPPIKTNGLPPESEQHYLRYEAVLPDLPLDARITYRVRNGQQIVRESSFATAASPPASVRVAMVGDLATGKDGQKAVAYRIAQEKPQALVALGDIVYPTGRINQYMHFFWGTYNETDEPGPKTGAPLMASVPFYPVLGNHDVGAKLPAYPDALGAYYFFRVPRNGPGAGPWTTPLGPDTTAAGRFRTLAGDSHPHIDAYSFDTGPVHFLVLPSNGSGNPDQPALRRWAERDLMSSSARWKIVCHHHPGFSSSSQHYTEQATRLWQPLFEACGVDAVFSGHVHNYQRTVPLTFKPSTGKRDKRGRVDGVFKLDRDFDGVANTRPSGVVHVIAGGGGATLYGPGLDKTAPLLRMLHGDNYADFTARMVADRHSFVILDASPDELRLRAIDAEGETIDSIRITKAAR